jgi:hypothetical protein
MRKFFAGPVHAARDREDHFPAMSCQDNLAFFQRITFHDHVTPSDIPREVILICMTIVQILLSIDFRKTDFESFFVTPDVSDPDLV